MDFSAAVARRLAIAERAAAAYITNPQVAAVLVAGSVARGLADERSDIELDIYWASAPTEAERVGQTPTSRRPGRRSSSVAPPNAAAAIAGDGPGGVPIRHTAVQGRRES